ncbi:hypothetical protein [Sodalis glossinidius]|uniref:hypothetical protein n=1 Tax=Sodalis glossinidius TaxID=63612 RepID=UPI0002F40243|nr:hypothetical protein [Sodalis glossinidius]
MVAELVKQGYEQSVALKGADRAVDHYRRSASASARGKMFDDCLHIAKVWQVNISRNARVLHDEHCSRLADDRSRYSG